MSVGRQERSNLEEAPPAASWEACTLPEDSGFGALGRLSCLSVPFMPAQSTLLSDPCLINEGPRTVDEACESWECSNGEVDKEAASTHFLSPSQPRG